MKYLPWLILSLPIITLWLVWDYLPDRASIHWSGRGADRFGSKSDFSGIIVAVTGSFAIISYVVLQISSSFQSISEKELQKAYIAISAGSALMGLTIITLVLLTH